MAHVSDFTQEDDKIVLDLINAENGTSFSVAELLVNNMQIISGANVSVRLSPAQGTGYGGTQDVTYNRISIQDFLDLYYPASLTLPLGDAEFISDFLDEINAGLGTNIKASQIVDGPIGEWEGLPNETKNINLYMTQTNLVYHGHGVIIVDGNDIPLANVVTQTVLSGLNLPKIGLEFSVENRISKHFRILIDRVQNFAGGNENNNTIRMSAGLGQINLFDAEGNNLSTREDVVFAESSGRVSSGGNWGAYAVFSPYTDYVEGATGWLSDQLPGSPVFINFTLNDLVQVNSFQLVNRNGVADAPVSFKFQVSEDGETWFTCKDFKEVSPWVDNTEQRTFNFIEDYTWEHGYVHARFVRVRFEENHSSNRIQISEVALLDQYNSKISFAGNTTAVASVFDPGYGAERVLDADFATVWRTPTGQYVNSTLTLTLDQERSLRRLFLRGSSTPGHSPKKLTLSYSEDGVSWSAGKLFQDIATWTSQSGKYFDFI